VGEGIPGSVAVGDAYRDGHVKIAIFGTGGPVYLLNADGTSALGNGPDGKPLTFSMEFTRTTATLDVPTLPGLGMGSFADLTGTGLARLSFVAPSVGLGRALSVALDEQRVVAEDHLTAWDTTTGAIAPGYPARMEDFQFITDPAVVGVGPGPAPAILEGSGGYLVHAWEPFGVEPLGWPKFTGNWVIATPATGDLLGDGGREVAVITREGSLFVWRTSAHASASREWWTSHHDEANTGNYATPPLRRASAASATLGIHVVVPPLAVGMLVVLRRRRAVAA